MKFQLSEFKAGSGNFFSCVILGFSALATPAAEPTLAAPNNSPQASYLSLPATPYRYAQLDLPAYLRVPATRRADNSPPENPVTDAGATLGRVLFYDTRLSANNSTACSSCHVQAHAFSDPQRFSVGFQGQTTDRHSMSLVNLRYYERGRFFRDERAGTLEQQVLMPIQSQSEMGNDLESLNRALAQDAEYRALFQKAFGDSLVTSDRVAKALAQFIRALVSTQSKYDVGRNRVQNRRDDFPNFTAQENRGKTRFLNDCASCHLPQNSEAAFIMDRPRNNGLDADFRVVDAGVGDVTMNSSDVGLYKSVSLRNIEVAGPYMHDGRLATLEEVVDLYSSDFRPHPNLSGGMRRLRLSAAEKADLVAFLKTLTDADFLKDVRFSDPFVVHPGAIPRPAALPSDHQITMNVAQAQNGRGGGRGPGRGNPPIRRGAPGRGGDLVPPGGGPGGRGGRGGRGPRGGSELSEQIVVNRLLAFDRDGSGTLGAQELPERMGRLFPVADANRDGALDRREITAAADQ